MRRSTGSASPSLAKDAKGAIPPSPTQPPRRAIRILCLHGLRQDGDKFRYQSKRLRDTVAQLLRGDLRAHHPTSPATTIKRSGDPPAGDGRRGGEVVQFYYRDAPFEVPRTDERDMVAMRSWFEPTTRVSVLGGQPRRPAAAAPRPKTVHEGSEALGDDDGDGEEEGGDDVDRDRQPPSDATWEAICTAVDSIGRAGEGWSVVTVTADGESAAEVPARGIASAEFDIVMGYSQGGSVAAMIALLAGAHQLQSREGHRITQLPCSCSKLHGVVVVHSPVELVVRMTHVDPGKMPVDVAVGPSSLLVPASLHVIATSDGCVSPASARSLMSLWPEGTARSALEHPGRHRFPQLAATCRAIAEWLLFTPLPINAAALDRSCAPGTLLAEEHELLQAVFNEEHVQLTPPPERSAMGGDRPLWTVRIAIAHAALDRWFATRLPSQHGGPKASNRVFVCFYIDPATYPQAVPAKFDFEGLPDAAVRGPGSTWRTRTLQSLRETADEMSAAGASSMLMALTTMADAEVSAHLDSVSADLARREADTSFGISLLADDAHLDPACQAEKEWETWVPLFTASGVDVACETTDQRQQRAVWERRATRIALAFDDGVRHRKSVFGGPPTKQPHLSAASTVPKLSKPPGSHPRRRGALHVGRGSGHNRRAGSRECGLCTRKRDVDRIHRMALRHRTHRQAIRRKKHVFQRHHGPRYGGGGCKGRCVSLHHNRTQYGPRVLRRAVSMWATASAKLAVTQRHSQ